MRTVEIKCWVTRDRKDEPLHMWQHKPQWVNARIGWSDLPCGSVPLPSIMRLGQLCLANRRGCWPATLVVEVDDAD